MFFDNKFICLIRHETKAACSQNTKKKMIKNIQYNEITCST